MRPLIVTLLLLLSAAACGPSSRPKPQCQSRSLDVYKPTGPVVIHRGHCVQFPASLAQDTDRQARLLDAISVHVDFFEKFELKLSPTIILLTEAKNFPNPFDADPRPLYQGCWFAPSNVILCWIGDHDEVPFLYHELNHKARFLSDHSDPSWARVYDNGILVAEEIRKRKKP